VLLDVKAVSILDAGDVIEALLESAVLLEGEATSILEAEDVTEKILESALLVDRAASILDSIDSIEGLLESVVLLGDRTTSMEVLKASVALLEDIRMSEEIVGDATTSNLAALTLIVESAEIVNELAEGVADAKEEVGTGIVLLVEVSGLVLEVSRTRLEAEIETSENELVGVSKILGEISEEREDCEDVS
jgi:hypothetical protein